jgi:hypothetical protein
VLTNDIPPIAATSCASAFWRRGTCRVLGGMSSRAAALRVRSLERHGAVSGWTPLPRRFEAIMSDGPAWQVLSKLLVRARHEPGLAVGSHGTELLDRGECLAGENELASQLKLGRQQIRAALKRLERVGVIARNPTKRGSVITLVDFDSYAAADASPNQAPTKPQPSPNQAPTTNKKERGKREKKDTCSNFDFEPLYQLYPRHTGKAKGMEKAAELITTDERYAKLEASVRKMHEAWKGHNTQYCPYWSTYINSKFWDDEVPPLPSNNHSPQEPNMELPWYRPEDER